ncbi:MAG: stage III sporulation protein AE [Firmicutes bacterium]|nr:stage III sporulation protein AE [Bacillota bacterium]
MALWETAIPQQSTQESLPPASLETLQSLWDQIVVAGGGPSLDLGKLAYSLLPGGPSPQWGAFFRALLNSLGGALASNVHEAAVLLAIGLMAALLSGLFTSFGKSAVATTAMSLVQMAMVVVSVGLFTRVLQLAQSAIDGESTALASLTPMVLAGLTATGGVAGAALLHPILVFSVQLSVQLMDHVIFPLIYASAVLGLVGSFAEGFPLTRLVRAMRGWALWIIGITSAVFVGVLSITGLSVGVENGLALRAAKYAVGEAVPVVGELFSDAAEALIGTSLAIRNVVGLLGLVVIAGIAFYPMLQILLNVLLVQLMAALLEPLGIGTMTNSVAEVGEALHGLFAAVGIVALLFFFGLGSVLASANVMAAMHG